VDTLEHILQVPAPPVTVSSRVEPEAETGESIHWSSFAYKLGLLGLAQEIAVNSTLESIRQNIIRLNLTADMHKLVNPVIEDEIRQAIATKLGVSLKLELHVQDALQVETPHLFKLRQQREQRQTAIEEIKQDGIVRKLGEAFGAELDESSVRKIGDDQGNLGLFDDAEVAQIAKTRGMNMKGALGDMMKKAQEMQENMQNAQQQLAKMEVTGESGGGLVQVVMRGTHEVNRVHIDATLVGEDKDMLEDLVAAAINDAVHKVGKANQEMMQDMTSGLNLPPGFKLPF